MSRSRIRIPMFVKFLIGCLALASLLIVGGTYVVKNETRLRSRGNYLAKHLRRLNGYIERVGNGMTGTLELIALDPALRDAVAGVPQTPPPPTIPPPDAASAVPVAPAGGARQVAVIAKGFYDQMMSRNGLQPDVFGVFSSTSRLLWAPEKGVLTPAELPELAAVERARNGGVFAHRVQLVSGVPYQVSALAIRAPGSDTVVGGVLIGVKLERYFQEYAEQTDMEDVLRIRPSLIDGLNVLASSWPDDRAELAKQLAPEKVVHAEVGDDVRDVVRTKKGDFDFFVEDLEGYRRGDASVLGRLYITRSRVNVIDPAQRLPWVEIVAGIVASLIIAFLLGLWVTRPIKQMLRQSRGLLAGDTDLTQRIHVSSNDETADLADNINQVFMRVHTLATGVQSAAFQVGASSAEISAASRQMLSGLKDQTLKIESSTTAVTELSASIQTVAGNAAQATEVAERSSTAVTSAVTRMEQIRAAVDDAATKMRDLGESSKRIGNIVEVIRQISEQTSMLALNASIEAAHAGEQGRGFAVVADEVSSLARRVGQSAKDIEALIQTVKEQTAAAIQSMEIGTREVVSGSQLVTSTLTGLGELVMVVKETATAVHEQAIVSDEIARNMDAVRGLAGEALHGSEESVVQAERLHELAFELEESIGDFNLDNTKVAGARPQAEKLARGFTAAKALPAGSAAGRGRGAHAGAAQGKAAARDGRRPGDE